MILTPLYDSNFALKMRVFGKSTLIVAFFLCCTFLRPSTSAITHCPQLPWPRNGHLACTTDSMVVNTECKAACNRGYNLHGSSTRECQGDRSWSGSPVLCKAVTCAPHPGVPLARVTPADCTTKPAFFDRVCSFVCPPGYILKTGSYESSSRHDVCQIDGKWQHGNLGHCLDRLQPDVICPRDVTVNAALGKHTAEVSWSVKTTDNSVSVEPSAHVSVSSSYTSPHTFPIGRHIVGVKATDRAGNSQHCDFHVTVKDAEPPKFQQCPADKIVQCSRYECVVTWSRPIATDNSGLSPVIRCSHNNADRFRRGKHIVKCVAMDKYSNTAECKFTITVKGLSCPPQPAPKNGALVCQEAGPDRLCLVQCNAKYDVPSTPATVYSCSGGKWITLFSAIQTTQWPDCSVNYLQGSARKLGGLYGTPRYYYYSGSASDPGVQTKIRQNFVTAMSSPYLPFCSIMFKCDVKNIKVYPGKTII